MKLIIAEKPDLGRAIAEAIPGIAQSKGNYIEKGEYYITWAFGHIIQLKEPEDYDDKYKLWKLEHLPIYFENWEQKIKIGKIKKNETQEEMEKRKRFDKGTEDQLNLIKKLLAQSDEVINAADPDDEGQFLVDEILEFLDNKKPVKRILINDNNTEAIKKAFGKLEPNEKFVPLGKSAYARAVSDLLVGVNITRFFTLKNNGAGVLSVGRVQTPTLALIVNRDLQIENHEKSYFYELEVNFLINKGSNKREQEETKKLIAEYQAQFIDSEKQKKLIEKITAEFGNLKQNIAVKFKYKPSKSIAEDGKIIDKKIIEAIEESIDKETYQSSLEKKILKEEAPLPFNLLKLQIYANNKWGYSPDKTLEISQSLREKYKAITYNRSDSQYLNEEHFLEASEVIEQAIENLKIIVPNIDTQPIKKPKCFDSSKVTAHHAIIPTKAKIDIAILTEEERNVYTAISNYYISQFLPHLVKERTEAIISVFDEEKLVATSIKILDYGFKTFLNDKFNDDEVEESSELSKLFGGEYECIVEGKNILEKETKPPKRYTEATLLQDMSSISKYCNQETKTILKTKDKEKKGENGGIGTPATRSNIIAEFFRRGYVEKKDKYIISTQKGREFIQIAPEELKTADLTARWWLIQEEIKEGTAEPSKLILNTLDIIRTIISREPLKMIYTANSKIKEKEVIGKCPKCGGDIFEGKTKEGKSSFYCGNYKENDCKFRLYGEMKFFHNILKITKAKAKKLLDSKVAFKLTSRSGKDYEAYLKIKLNGDFVNFEQVGFVEKKK